MSRANRYNYNKSALFLWEDAGCFVFLLSCVAFYLSCFYVTLSKGFVDSYCSVFAVSDVCLVGVKVKLY